MTMQTVWIHLYEDNYADRVGSFVKNPEYSNKEKMRYVD